MIKNKYQSLNHKERKIARENFYKTDFGKIQKPRFNRLLITSILLLIYGLYLLIEAVITKASIFSYTAAILILVISGVFFVGRSQIINKNVNNYLIKNKK